MRDHLEIVHRQTGVMPDQLKPVEVPEFILYLWGWFCELSGGRGYSEVGPLPLTYTEIQAWAMLTKAEPAAWEIEVLKRIDKAFISESMRKR